MPTYDYECGACGHAFERWQEITARKLRTCPACKKKKLTRLVGAGAGVIFKGSGFYETDYKRKASKPSTSEASGKEGSSKEASGKATSGKQTSGKEGTTKGGSSSKAASDKSASSKDAKSAS